MGNIVSMYTSLQSLKFDILQYDNISKKKTLIWQSPFVTYKQKCSVIRWEWKFKNAYMFINMFDIPSSVLKVGNNADWIIYCLIIINLDIMLY